MAKTATKEAKKEAAPDEAAPVGAGRLVTALPGIGDRLAEILAKLGIHTLADLLFHLPVRYQDRTTVSRIGTLRPGDDAVIVGQIAIAQIAYGRRRSLICKVSDRTGMITIRMFHFSPNQKNNLARGRWIVCFGEVRAGGTGIELIHPEYTVYERKPDNPTEDSLTSVYKTTEGISQQRLRQFINKTLADEVPELVELLPPEVLAETSYPPLLDAVRLLHHPPPDISQAQLLEGSHPAQHRLAFEELLAHHLSLRKLRLERQDNNAPSMKPKGALKNKFIKALDFDLTDAQKRVVDEVIADFKLKQPSLRLVQGDVGSGKTVVAAAAALWAIEAGWQVSVMAPTELLAEQHHRSFKAWFEPLGLKVTGLTGKLGAKARREALAAMADGSADVVVGTHALFQDGVEFHKLGLVIVDEQHRFGVDQRLALREKGVGDEVVPHQMTMTATPIPRTMAMVFYADIDVSSIDELPPGRIPVETVVAPEGRRPEILDRVRSACEEGRQAYWVCPLIDESDNLQAQAATETERQFTESFPDLSIGLIHGRMKGADKDKVMEKFRSGEIQLLVATTVIEVGVDVPNASLMIIENAERLGLSQLHQLRGRVGRGADKSACVLLYKSPLGKLARDRLAIMRDTNDGFEIARHDLHHRGPGEVLGTRQTGLADLKVADLARDQDLFPEIERIGGILLDEHPENVELLIRRWIGGSTDYGHV